MMHRPGFAHLKANPRIGLNVGQEVAAAPAGVQEQMLALFIHVHQRRDIRPTGRIAGADMRDSVMAEKCAGLIVRHLPVAARHASATV